MNVLIIGVGQLGNHVLENLSKNESAKIETFTKSLSEKQALNSQNIKTLDSLENANQPDIIFITANSYKPTDRAKYLQDHSEGEDYLNFRDDEKTKNQKMILDIIQGLKHLKPTRVILTANPPELLVELVHQELKWDSVYNMQMMLDNMRIGRIANAQDDEYLCIGEHGRPTPTLAHLQSTSDEEYEHINKELAKVGRVVYEDLHGAPPLEDAKIALDKLIKAITNDTELRCVLTAPDNGVSFGKPFIVKGLDIIEQPMPELSPKEKTIFEETKIRLTKKWGDKKENTNEPRIKLK